MTDTDKQMEYVAPELVELQLAKACGKEIGDLDLYTSGQEIDLGIDDDEEEEDA